MFFSPVVSIVYDNWEGNRQFQSFIKARGFYWSEVGGKKIENSVIDPPTFR